MQANTIHTLQRKTAMSHVTLRTGYWFYFEHQGNDISLFGSVWSGKEKVFFNNKEVSSFRNLGRLKSTHSFVQGNNNYEVKTQMTNWLLGTVEVNLYCNGELIDTEVLKPLSFKKETIWLLMPSLFLGAAAGYLVSFLLQ